MPQLSRHINLTSVGFSTAEGAVDVDTSGCEGVLFIGVPGTTAVRLWSMALKSGATTTGLVACGSTFTHASTAADNSVLITDVYKPKKRWIQATLSSSTATPSRLLAFKYGTHKHVGDFEAASGVPVASGGIHRVVSPSSAT